MLRPSGKVTYFRVAPVDSWQGVFAAEFASSSQSYHTAYVLDDTSLYSMLLTRHFTQEFRKYGGHILGYDSLRPMTDYTQELTKIAALHPDMIYFGGVDSTGGITLYKQMASIPGLTHTPFIGGDGILTDAFARAVGTPHGPVYSTLGTVDVTRIPSMAGFVNTYQAAYGPLSISTNYPYGGLYSAYSYDSAKILLNAIKTAVTTGFTARKSCSTRSKRLSRLAFKCLLRAAQPKQPLSSARQSSTRWQKQIMTAFSAIKASMPMVTRPTTASPSTSSQMSIVLLPGSI